MGIRSFDIFDTCLVRACGAPHEIFAILANRVITNATSAQIAEFKRIRIAGEQDARKRSANEEVSLAEIYSCCDFSGVTSISNKQIMDSELDIEEENLKPVLSILDSIKVLRQDGHKIIFISDMYLPFDFIKSLMQKYGFLTDNDRLYLSSDKLTTKASGRLYQTIKNDLSIDSNNWRHFGDNYSSDIVTANHQGISTQIINHKFTPAEQYSSKISSQSPLSKNISAFISKSVRLQLPPTAENEFAADFIAPLFVPFVYWIFDNAQKRGITKLFFAARDGEILYEIAKEFQPLFPEISIEYVYLSRLSIYFPASKSFEEIIDLIDWDMVENQDINDVLNYYFGFNYPQRITKDILLNDKHIKDSLLKCRDKAKENTLSYFSQAGLASSNGKTIALIDLRGTGRSYQAINNLLQSNGFDPIKAFYYEMTPNRINYSSSEQYQFAFAQETYNGAFSRLNQAYALLESYFAAANHPRTLRYQVSDTGKIVPVFDRCPEIDQKSQIFNINKTASNLWAKAFISTNAYCNYQDYVNTGIMLLNYFMSKPEEKFLEFLSKISISETGLDQDYLVHSLSLKEMILGHYTDKSISWYEGSYKYTLNNNRLYSDFVFRGIRKAINTVKRIIKLLTRKFH